MNNTSRSRFAMAKRNYEPKVRMAALRAMRARFPQRPQSAVPRFLYSPDWESSPQYVAASILELRLSPYSGGATSRL